MPRLGEHASPFRMGAVVHPTAPATPCDDADAPEQRPDTSDAPQPWHQTPRDSRPSGEYAGSEGPAEATGHAGSGHVTCRMAAPRRPERFPNCRGVCCAVQDARDKRCGSGRRRGAIRPRPATTKLRSPKRQAPVSALRQTEFATTLQRSGQERAHGGLAGPLSSWRVRVLSRVRAQCPRALRSRIAVSAAHMRPRPGGRQLVPRTCNAACGRRAVLCRSGLPRRGGRVVRAWISAFCAVRACIRACRTGKPSKIRCAPPATYGGARLNSNFCPLEAPLCVMAAGLAGMGLQNGSLLLRSS